MPKKTKEKSRDDEVPASKKLEDLWDMVDEMEIAMLTTRRPDGRLVSRPMQVQERTDDGHLWFMAEEDTHKLDEIEHDPHVNLGFYKDRSREWISISGRARLERSRDKVRALYKPDWKAWLGDEGGTRNGGPDDPRITLIDVEAETVEYLKVDKPRAVVFFQVAKAIVTGAPPDLGSERHVTQREIVQESPLK
ncbi:MAG TPA: pyridoxamine 5'-phosphate oxidase family protein [Gemmatimonadaceae bacterium]|nr:pyridoxamine 5'-phosphate oxidase family protein [Gemmatimonadaceae bacterium]